MSWTIAADLVVAVHLLWILFLIFGALAGRALARPDRRPTMRDLWWTHGDRYGARRPY